MNKYVIIGVIAAVFFGLVGYAFVRSSANPSPTNTPAPTPHDESVIMDPGEAEKIAQEQSGESMYIPFVEQDYQAALSSGKIVMLNFYADWCPICRTEAPEIEEAFAQLKDPRIVGFRVNFKDGDTDDAEKKLATQFKIPYQHTKVFLKNGQEVERYSEQWDQEAATAALKKAVQ